MKNAYLLRDEMPADLDCLSEELRIEAWKNIKINKVNKKSIISHLPFLYELLESQTLWIKVYAWSSVVELHDGGIINTKDMEKLSVLLEHKNEETRYPAWAGILSIIKNKSPKSLLKIVYSKLSFFYMMLNSKVLWIRTSSWNLAFSMYYSGILSASNIKKNFKSFYELLQSRNIEYRYKAWNMVDFFVLEKIGLNAIYRAKTKYLELLKVKDLELRAHAWALSPHLIDLKIINTGEMVPYMKYLDNDITKEVAYLQDLLGTCTNSTCS
ncbi:MAG: hypothetical protein ACP5UL_02420 [Thermoplasmata archaeon]